MQQGRFANRPYMRIALAAGVRVVFFVDFLAYHAAAYLGAPALLEGFGLLGMARSRRLTSCLFSGRAGVCDGRFAFGRFPGIYAIIPARGLTRAPILGYVPGGLASSSRLPAFPRIHSGTILVLLRVIPVTVVKRLLVCVLVTGSPLRVRAVAGP